MSIFGKKNKNGDRSVNLSYVDGVESYDKGTAIALSIDNTNECVTMSARVYKRPKFEQITGIDVVSEKEIVEKSKNTVGRAMIGGMLLGHLGAIIGGMSGIGSKKSSETTFYMIINYRSQSGEIKVLSFKIVGASLHWSSFVDELKNKIKITPIEIEKEIYL